MHKKLGYLTMFGMLKGENEYTYPPYSAKQAKELIDTLQGIADYIIIDCGSYIANDILSAVSLMEAHSVLRLANCDLKSVSYLSSQLPLLKDNKWDADKQFKVANNIKRFEASEHADQVLGSVAYKIPHTNEISIQYLAGNLFKDLNFTDSRRFKKETAKICREVFGC
jgi:MinD-like ATPase involved in chromosome partitioning or flagellar assembly